MGYLLAQNTVNGAEGKVFVTINGRNVEAAGMKNIQTNVEIQSQDMRVVGTRKIQSKPNGAKLTGKGNVYYGTDVFRDMVLQYINTGTMPEFSIQITNDDAASGIGRQVMAYYGCTLTGTVPISILDDEQSMLRYDFNFAWTRAAKLEAFTAPAQYGTDE